jgi:23S rRNA pseudouridine1911/1915/1917 synthase
MEDGKKMSKLNILYEDNHIIVVEKIVGILSQQDSTRDMDMLTLIKQYIKDKYKKLGNVYVGLVHRLDRMVGGVMVFAKTSKAASRISEQIRNKTFKKSYLAIVNGLFDTKEGILEDYLIKDELNNISKVVTISNENSKLARLSYKVIDENNQLNLSLIDINLETGRHHQIRVQMANINHPLYGDIKYGCKVNKPIALFAYKLQFKHPVKDELLEFKLFPEKDSIWKEFNYKKGE